MQTSDHQMKTYNQTQLHDLGLQAIKQDNENYNKKVIPEVIPESDVTWILAKTITGNKN